MKHILVLNYEYPPLGGGASPVSYEISEGYAKLGYKVDVITMGYRDLPEYQEQGNITVYRVKCWRSKKSVCYPWEQASYVFAGYKKAKELLKTHSYDICHTHFIIPTGIIAYRLKKNFGLNYIITAHGSDVPGYNQNRFTLLHKLTPPLLKKIILQSKQVICPSKYLQDLILMMDATLKHKLTVIPNGIEVEKFQPLTKEKYILTVSRLQKGKGIQDLLTAIHHLDIGDWKVKIVGDGPYRETLERIVAEYGLSDRVEFLGWVDNTSDEMKELYGRASIFCQPSYFESFGITLLEGMQAGCVIIARNIGGFSWIKEHTNNIVFENTKDLNNKISKLINDWKGLKSISEDNLEKIKDFEWDEIVKKYEKSLVEYL